MTNGKNCFNRLRPKSTEPPITATTFFKFQLAVPQELQEFCADEKVCFKDNNFCSKYINDSRLQTSTVNL